jgi:hypothetical protein
MKQEKDNIGEKKTAWFNLISKYFTGNPIAALLLWKIFFCTLKRSWRLSFWTPNRQ